MLRIALAVPLYKLFDYLPPESGDSHKLLPGVRLEVPFGKSKKIGFLIELVANSEIAANKLKPVFQVLDDEPFLSKQDMRLLHWASDYYHHPLGEVISTAFPTLLRTTKMPMPIEEKCYALTAHSNVSGLDSLKRSPKQQQVWSYIQQKAVVSLTELKSWDKSVLPALQALIKKGLLTQVDVAANNPVEGAGLQVAYGVTTHPDKQLELNSEQQFAVDTVIAGLNKFAVYLLDGVTGSGKTEVYMQIIRAVLTRGQQVLVLVPEINLTPQLETRFRLRFFAPLAISHSNLTDRQRYTSWLAMQQGASYIMLGTRSALFTPLKNPGLIILDEEHDASFKQQEGFRFSARDTAIMRGKLLDIPVLLGSATPSLESLYNVDRQRYRQLILSQRAGQAAAPDLLLLDIRNKKMQHGLSEGLLIELRAPLARGEQVLLFLNRRGFAPTLICHGCGWVARCRSCDANLVIHNREKKLRCHHCTKEQRLFDDCPACGSKELTPLGMGTERIEQGLLELFPEYSLVRLDRDTTQQKGSLERYLEQINTGKANIILGTQMLAKGHHFPNVTVVALVDVDSGLFSIDFHATEKMAQMIVQVAGRAGRAEKPGKVIIQTRQPDHPLLSTLLSQGYSQFARFALAERKQAALPPYTYHALLRAHAGKPELPMVFLQAAASTITNKGRRVQILGPVPAPMEKRAGLYRYQLLFQCSHRAELQVCLDQLIASMDVIPCAKKVRWSLDVDPVDLY